MTTDPKRSHIMRSVKGKNSQPEMTVRRLIHGMGYRYRLHRKDLPGMPDLVFGPRKKVIFVHGCFWHGHSCKRGNRQPKTNAEYWKNKISRNVQRDADSIEQLGKTGWDCLVIWECEIKDIDTTANNIKHFLLSQAFSTEGLHFQTSF